MNGLFEHYQIFFGVFFIFAGVVNVATMWYRGRIQRREDPSFIDIHKRILAWFFAAMTLPFIVLFFGLEVLGLDFPTMVQEGSYDNSIVVVFVALVFCTSAGFAYYVFARGGAEELTRLQPLFGLQPASLNTPLVWKWFAALLVPLQAFALFLLYFLGTSALGTI